MSNKLRAITREAAKAKPQMFPLPEAIAKQIAGTDRQINALQTDLQTLRLVRENQILNAALELGLNKTELGALEIAIDGSGQLVFRPLAKKQATVEPAK